MSLIGNLASILNCASNNIEKYVIGNLASILNHASNNIEKY